MSPFHTAMGFVVLAYARGYDDVLSSVAGDADGGHRPMVTHPIWRGVVERTPLEEVFEDRSPADGRGKPVTSRHEHNPNFPAQTFHNVCLRFESEGSSHLLRGGAPFWHRERGSTTLVVLKGSMPIPRQVQTDFHWKFRSFYACSTTLTSKLLCVETGRRLVARSVPPPSGVQRPGRWQGCHHGRQWLLGVLALLVSLPPLLD